MPCNIEGHNHVWPTEGELVIEKCERYCGFCDEEYAEHEWKFAWFLRRHVKTVHCRPDADYPNIVVSDTWTGAPAKRPRLPSRSVRRARRNTEIAAHDGVKKEPKTPSPKKRGRATSYPTPGSSDPQTPEERIDIAMESFTMSSSPESEKGRGPTTEEMAKPNPAELREIFVKTIQVLSEQGLAADMTAKEVAGFMGQESIRLYGMTEFEEQAIRNAWKAKIEKVNAEDDEITDVGEELVADSEDESMSETEENIFGEEYAELE